jgi:L-amino acid N-acyltransferase YncA
MVLYSICGWQGIHRLLVKETEMASIRPVVVQDAEAIVTIYNHYVLKTIMTFEEEAVPATEIIRRIEEVQDASLPWLVAELAGAVVGYAYATKWRLRYAYRFSVEVTVYVDPLSGNRGIGSDLYTHLVAALRDRGVHTAMGGIALPNDASVALHEKFGFKKVAHFEEVGFKFSRWIDVGYWARIL